jgi:HEAT repeat protein
MKTLDQVRSLLSDIEPSEQTFASLNVEDLPQLEALLSHDEEEWMSARAVHALSRIDDPRARQAIVRASADARPTLRIAVARALPRLEAPVHERLLDTLLDDADVGVRKFALGSVPLAVAAGTRAKIGRIAESDGSEALRALAGAVLARATAPIPRKPIVIKPRRTPR